MVSPGADRDAAASHRRRTGGHRLRVLVAEADLSARGRASAAQIALPFDAPGTLAPGSLSPASDALHVAPRTSPLAPVLVRHPRARRYVLRVGADGAVRVTIPRWGSKRGAMAFAEQQRAWIAQQQQRVAAARAAERLRPRPDAESIRLLRLRAARELPARLLELAAEHGLCVSGVSIRDQRWRWGSCSRAGHVCLNWRLAIVPPAVRDYVIVHELMHLKRMDHSPRFWTLVEQLVPAYRELRRQLREFEHLLETRA